jgi:hypothetical protein
MKGLAIAVSCLSDSGGDGPRVPDSKAEVFHAAIPHEKLHNIHLKITHNPQFLAAAAIAEHG